MLAASKEHAIHDGALPLATMALKLSGMGFLMFTIHPQRPHVYRWSDRRDWSL